jgi:hypothetical protein
VEERIAFALVHEDKGRNVFLVERSCHLNQTGSRATHGDEASVHVGLPHVQLVTNGGANPDVLNDRCNGKHQKGPLQQTRKRRASPRRLLAEYVRVKLGQLTTTAQTTRYTPRTARNGTTRAYVVVPASPFHLIGHLSQVRKRADCTFYNSSTHQFEDFVYFKQSGSMTKSLLHTCTI